MIMQLAECGLGFLGVWGCFATLPRNITAPLSICLLLAPLFDLRGNDCQKVRGGGGYFNLNSLPRVFAR